MLIIIQHILGLFFTVRTGAYSRFLYVNGKLSQWGWRYVNLAALRRLGILCIFYCLLFILDI